LNPYYEHGGITIYHGDCREVLPTLDRVDLVLTDPPYGIGEAAGKNKSRWQICAPTDYGVSGWDDKPIDRDLLSATIGAGLHACIFGGNYYMVPPASCWLIWDKVNYGSDFADCEMAWTNYGTAVRMIKHQWNGMLREGREARIGHPTQKPVDLMRWCIEKCPNDPQTILDPFMGSGTTLRAAKDLGRECIGIELEEKYCEIAANRLSQEVLDFGG
jgi:DNA modification methylase